MRKLVLFNQTVVSHQDYFHIRTHELTQHFSQPDKNHPLNVYILFNLFVVQRQLR